MIRSFEYVEMERRYRFRSRWLLNTMLILIVLVVGHVDGIRLRSQEPTNILMSHLSSVPGSSTLMPDRIEASGTEPSWPSALRIPFPEDMGAQDGAGGDLPGSFEGQDPPRLPKLPEHYSDGAEDDESNESSNHELESPPPPLPKKPEGLDSHFLDAAERSKIIDENKRGGTNAVTDIVPPPPSKPQNGEMNSGGKTNGDAGLDTVDTHTVEEASSANGNNGVVDR